MKRYRSGDHKEVVGYKKPPRHSQFKPGQSGNPKGRPKGVHNFATDIRAALRAPVQITQDGVVRVVSTQEALLLSLKSKGLKGDTRALERLLLLAQSYNAADPNGPEKFIDHEALLKIYRQRVLNGAVDKE